MSTVRLAVAANKATMLKSLAYPHIEDPENLPALLVSYAYWHLFRLFRHNIYFRDFVLDSGAFSAHKIGTEIRIQDYISFCKSLKEGDTKLTEIFSLDVIGDWQASLVNTEKMWAAGIEAIPCYHAGEPEHVLMEMAAQYPKIALGGSVGLSTERKNAWALNCMARIWPKKVHGFGFGSESSVLAVPFHSVDASNWAQGPQRHNRFASMGQKQLMVGGASRDLKMEVRYYTELERKARHRWQKEMAELDALG